MSSISSKPGRQCKFTANKVLARKPGWQRKSAANVALDCRSSTNQDAESQSEVSDDILELSTQDSGGQELKINQSSQSRILVIQIAVIQLIRMLKVSWKYRDSGGQELEDKPELSEQDTSDSDCSYSTNQDAESQSEVSVSLLYIVEKSTAVADAVVHCLA
ncbi:hypothetical protein CEXT_806082 [Caerostris extrusa]|uniref:Uncharacterized protein n=1 Tax=Caerostris extrusa TaxID=172846 RepID=A0AAV4TTS6_CAEEX|nr:hypothetical protein CEXT_806082 [Caerostris extrusa]